jgi:D-inositol-3-phosphate glycosyltransferase
MQQARRKLRNGILEAAEMIGACFESGGKLLVCGNGGSAVDAQHFAAEFVGRSGCEGRPALPTLALNTDTAFFTAWSNDYCYERIFARQVEAFGSENDLLLGISTSGSSRNLIEAFAAARDRGLRTIALLGRDGGQLHELAELPLVVPSSQTQHIQVAQLVVLRLLCELVEERHSDGLSASGAGATSFVSYEEGGSFSR